MNYQKGNGLVWTTLVIAIIALILAWVAYNRTGVNIEEQVQAEINEAFAELNIELDTLERQIREGTADTLQDGADEVRTDE